MTNGLKRIAKAHKASKAKAEARSLIKGGACEHCGSFEVLKTKYVTKPFKFYCNKKGMFVDPQGGCVEESL